MATITRGAVEIAARIYECQEAAKVLFADEYEKKIKWYKNVILRVCKDHSCDTLKAVLFICNMESIKDNGTAVMMFMAAAVEIVEPSEKS
jgi:peptide deformylase